MRVKTPAHYIKQWDALKFILRNTEDNFLVVQWNGHAEYILLSMISDWFKVIRQVQWRTLLKALITGKDCIYIEASKPWIPSWNFQLKYDSIDWQSTAYLEVSYIVLFQDYDIKNFIV